MFIKETNVNAFGPVVLQGRMLRSFMWYESRPLTKACLGDQTKETKQAKHLSPQLKDHDPVFGKLCGGVEECLQMRRRLCSVPC